MSAALLYLNPRLTADQAMALHKMQMDSAIELANKFKASLESIEDPKQRKLYFDQCYPLVMQQIIMAMF